LPKVIAVTYSASEARQELLDTLAEAIDEIADSLAALGAAYEQLGTMPADKLEEELFRPVQAAYGRAKRTHSGFAQRHGLPERQFSPANAGLPSTGIRGFVDNAVDSAAEAEAVLAELQDSMRPVEVGDAELRAGLAEVRELLGDVRGRAREFVRTLGR
jgi:ABC-type transporter Mla subunit MlaD